MESKRTTRWVVAAASLVLSIALVATAAAAITLPFAVDSNPFSISPSLYAVPPPQSGTSTFATASTEHLDGRPFPTGAWWTNLVLDEGDTTVVAFPYALRVRDGKLHASYPFRVVTPSVIQSGFVSEIVLGAACPTPPQHQVVEFDVFSVAVDFKSNATKTLFTTRLVRGSPFLTTEYSDSKPTIESMDGVQITGLRRLDADAALDSKGRQVPFAVYALQLSNGHVWYAFASDSRIDLVLSDDRRRVEATKPFNGVLRVALAPTQDAFPYLIDSAAVFPTGGAVKYKVDAAKDVATVEFQWKTRRLDGTASLEGAQLMMLALPHHVDAMDKSANTLLSDVRYTSIRGMMTGVTGDVWRMTETLPAVEWDYKDDGLFRADLPPSQAETAADARRRIVESLRRDVAVSAQPLSADSYNFGKLIGRDARLLLTAARFEQQDLVTTMLEKMKRELTPWLTGANPNALLYDRTFGGVVTTDGLRDSAADFGNGRYNDHHFHYGYFVYALAVVRKFDAAFIDAHASAVAMLMGDFGAPLDRETAFFGDFPALEYFPTARHKDWFVGHSYASGLFPIQDGKSQESSSEAVNAYYALSLFASLDKNKDDQKAYVHYARVLLALEIHAAKTYWHMRENSQVYEPTFARNAMVGVVGDMSVVYSTWFGDRPEYVHGINMIPVTPITSHLMVEPYVAREFPLLRDSLARLGADDIWKSVLVMNHAILDAAAAWEELATGVTAFDSWNSRANALFWIATRPSWFEQKNRKRLTVPNYHEDDKCFGYPECSVAGANGTALQCCGSLPGCCPSALGCCPKRDPTDLPLNACFGEHSCAVLGLGCCNSIQGCCEPDPVTGIVLGCCKNQSPRPVTSRPAAPAGASTAGFCTNQPRCRALKLMCCETSDGCCKADPITGNKLDCCVLEATSNTSYTAVVSQANGDDDSTATCHHQPRCAAAKLDCCGTSKGCCEPDPITGGVLDCCDATPSPSPSSSPSTTKEDDGTCHNEPQCALAKLDCCASPEGCCRPDPVTGATLLCCQHPKSSSTSGNATSAPAKTGGDAASFGSCHNEPRCLTAGENNTPLMCCGTKEGCCPGLLCCSETKASTRSDGDGSSSAPARHSVVSQVLAVVVAVFLLAACGFCLAMCYRRRHYAPIEHDMRAWYCTALMLVVAGGFVYLLFWA
ncbi:hypothetical protein PINS_up006862 [Pythium insidiosum]|nr:hypothetical protein PINS_up006862 [Pythium insidiosum]